MAADTSEGSLCPAPTAPAEDFETVKMSASQRNSFVVILNENFFHQCEGIPEEGGSPAALRLKELTEKDRPAHPFPEQIMVPILTTLKDLFADATFYLGKVPWAAGKAKQEEKPVVDVGSSKCKIYGPPGYYVNGMTPSLTEDLDEEKAKAEFGADPEIAADATKLMEFQMKLLQDILPGWCRDAKQGSIKLMGTAGLRALEVGDDDITVDAVLRSDNNKANFRGLYKTPNPDFEGCKIHIIDGMEEGALEFDAALNVYRVDPAVSDILFLSMGGKSTQMRRVLRSHEPFEIISFELGKGYFKNQDEVAMQTARDSKDALLGLLAEFNAERAREL